MSDLLKKKDVLAFGDDMYISLSKLLGQPVVDAVGYVSMEAGEATFKLSRLVLADGSQVDVEGEHDFPYVCEFANWPQSGLAPEQLEALFDEDE